MLRFEFLSFVTIWVWSRFDLFSCHNLSLVTTWVFEFCHIVSFLKIFSQLEFLSFYHNLSFWVSSQLEFSSFITIRVFKFHHNEFFSFITIWVFEFHPDLSCWVSSQFEFLSFITIWVFWFHHNLSFWVLSQFKFLSFIAIWVF